MRRTHLLMLNPAEMLLLLVVSHQHEENNFSVHPHSGQKFLEKFSLYDFHPKFGI